VKKTEAIQKKVLFFMISFVQLLMTGYFILQLFITKDFYYFLGIIVWGFLFKKYVFDKNRNFLI
jgi:hypothetical protein